MKRASLAALGLLVVLVASSGAPAKDLRVRHGQGIGRVNLGMTVAQVRRALGPPESLARRKPRRGGRLYVEYQWDLGLRAVGLLGRPGRLRVVKVSTVKRAERTPEGLGVGSTATQLDRRLDWLSCHEFISPGNNPRPLMECVYRLPSGRQTAFMVEKWNSRVAIVEVRARGCDFYGRNCGSRAVAAEELEPESVASPSADARVRHGEGIGRLHLGMTLSQVREVLGRGALVVQRKPRSRGRIYLEYQWDFARWTVGLLGASGRVRVVKIGSMDRAQRTPERLGIGNTPAELGRELQPLRCIDVYAPSGPPAVTHSECAYTLPSGRQTVFIFDMRGGFKYDPDQHVAVVEVRARGCDYWGRNCGR